VPPHTYTLTMMMNFIYFYQQSFCCYCTYNTAHTECESFNFTCLSSSFSIHFSFAVHLEMKFITLDCISHILHMKYSKYNLVSAKSVAFPSHSLYHFITTTMIFSVKRIFLVAAYACCYCYNEIRELIIADAA
jgi:hypothetical protein